MRRSSLWSFALVALLAVPAGAQDTRPGIAVMPFDNGGSFGRDAEDFDAMRVGLPQMLVTELLRNPNARVVDRFALKRILEEQDLGASGRVDPETAARVGRLVGARYMVLGSFIDFYGDVRVDTRIVDVETSEVIKAQAVRDERAKLFDIVTQVADKIMQDVNLPPLSSSARQSRQAPPEEALNYYMRGLLAADIGNEVKARELFSLAMDVFPDYTEAEEELKQLTN